MDDSSEIVKFRVARDQFDVIEKQLVQVHADREKSRATIKHIDGERLQAQLEVTEVQRSLQEKRQRLVQIGDSLQTEKTSLEKLDVLVAELEREQQLLVKSISASVNHIATELSTSPAAATSAVARIQSSSRAASTPARAVMTSQADAKLPANFTLDPETGEVFALSCFYCEANANHRGKTFFSKQGLSTHIGHMHKGQRVEFHRQPWSADGIKRLKSGEITYEQNYGVDPEPPPTTSRTSISKAHNQSIEPPMPRLSSAPLNVRAGSGGIPNPLTPVSQPEENTVNQDLHRRRATPAESDEIRTAVQPLDKQIAAGDTAENGKKQEVRKKYVALSSSSAAPKSREFGVSEPHLSTKRLSGAQDRRVATMVPSMRRKRLDETEEATPISAARASLDTAGPPQKAPRLMSNAWLSMLKNIETTERDAERPTIRVSDHTERLHLPATEVDDDESQSLFLHRKGRLGIPRKEVEHAFRKYSHQLSCEGEAPFLIPSIVKETEHFQCVFASRSEARRLSGGILWCQGGSWRLHPYREGTRAFILTETEGFHHWNVRDSVRDHCGDSNFKMYRRIRGEGYWFVFEQALSPRSGMVLVSGHNYSKKSRRVRLASALTAPCADCGQSHWESPCADGQEVVPRVA